MSTVQLAPRNFTPTVPIGAAPIDQAAAMAPGRAIEGAGQELRRSAEMLARIAGDVQNHVNKGILASEQTHRMETAAAIDQYIQSNPGNPESWSKFSEDTLAAYNQGRQDRMRTNKWGSSVSDADTIANEEFWTRTDIGVRMKMNQGMIRKSNAQIKAQADAELRAGNYQGFKDGIEQMNLTEEQRTKTLSEGLEQGLYNIASNQMDAIEEETLADQISGYETFIDNVTAKDEDGRFTEYEESDEEGTPLGGMSLGGRTRLQSIANARLRQARKQVASNGRLLLRDITAGRKTQFDVDQALASGEITQDVVDLLQPDLEAAEQYAKDKAAQDLLEEGVRATSRAATDEKAALNGTIGADEIQAKVVAGEYTEEQGNTIIARMNARTQFQRTDETSDYFKINEKILAKYGGNLTSGNPQPDDKTYQTMLDNIKEADLTMENRMDLAEKFLAMRSTDLKDLEEEGTGWFFDRAFTPQEKNARREFIDTVAENIGVLGPVAAGELMLSTDLEIRQWFISNPKANPGQIKEYVESLKQRAGEQAADSLFEDFGM